MATIFAQDKYWLPVQGTRLSYTASDTILRLETLQYRTFKLSMPAMSILQKGPSIKRKPPYWGPQISSSPVCWECSPGQNKPWTSDIQQHCTLPTSQDQCICQWCSWCGTMFILLSFRQHSVYKQMVRWSQQHTETGLPHLWRPPLFKGLPPPLYGIGYQNEVSSN